MVLFVLLGSSFVSVGVSSVIWTQSYGGADEQDVASLVETSDGGFALAGNTLSIVGNLEDYFLVKTDSSGNMLWNKTYGGSDRDYAYSVVEASDGGFALVGYSSFSNSVFWLVKTDSSGNMEWNKNYGESLGWDGYPVIATSDGGFALVGSNAGISPDGDFWLIRERIYGMDYRE